MAFLISNKVNYQTDTCRDSLARDIVELASQQVPTIGYTPGIWHKGPNQHGINVSTSEISVLLLALYHPQFPFIRHKQLNICDW